MVEDHHHIHRSGARHHSAYHAVAADVPGFSGPVPEGVRMEDKGVIDGTLHLIGGTALQLDATIQGERADAD